MADQMGEILHNAFDKILADNDIKKRTICFISYKKKKIEKQKYAALYISVLLFLINSIFIVVKFCFS